MEMLNYERWAWGIAQELRDTLSSTDARALSAELRVMGQAAWVEWAVQNRKTAFEVLARTPAARTKLPAWADAPLQRKLVLLAHRQAHLAASLLNAANQLAPGGSYRAECVHAARLAESFLADADWTWPFDCEPPFADWQAEE